MAAARQRLARPTAAQHGTLTWGGRRGWQAPHRASAGVQTPLEHKIHFQNINHTIAQEGDPLEAVDFPEGNGTFPGMFKRRAKLDVTERVRRLENLVLALVGKVRKMAEGQAHFEHSFKTLQDAVTGMGRDMRGKIQDMVAAHDQRDDQAFEDHAGQLDEMINQVQNLGTGGNTATKAGQSPTTTAGRSTGDLPQGRGPLASENQNTGVAGSAGDQPARASGGGDKEHDVVVKGRDMPE